jgi:hypothetical protein
MPGLWFYSDPIDRLHQEQLQFDRSRRRFVPDSAHNRRTEQRAIEAIIGHVQELGLRINLTTRNAPFDLWIEGVRVEVKAATWRDTRYQAAIRNHRADILIFDCINGTHHFHVIPMPAIAPRKSISVWRYDPAQSAGQWQPYLDNWQHLIEAARHANHTWQPPLF